MFNKHSSNSNGIPIYWVSDCQWSQPQPYAQVTWCHGERFSVWTKPWLFQVPGEFMAGKHGRISPIPPRFDRKYLWFCNGFVYELGALSGGMSSHPCLGRPCTLLDSWSLAQPEVPQLIWETIKGPGPCSAQAAERVFVSSLSGIMSSRLVVWLPFFIFPYIGNNHPKWLIFFTGVQSTNQLAWQLGHSGYPLATHAALTRICCQDGSREWSLDWLEGWFCRLCHTVIAGSGISAMNCAMGS